MNWICGKLCERAWMVSELRWRETIHRQIRETVTKTIKVFNPRYTILSVDEVLLPLIGMSEKFLFFNFYLMFQFFSRENNSFCLSLSTVFFVPTCLKIVFVSPQNPFSEEAETKQSTRHIIEPNCQINLSNRIQDDVYWDRYALLFFRVHKKSRCWSQMFGQKSYPSMRKWQ